MKYLVYHKPEKTSYDVCILVPSIRKDDIQKEYLTAGGISPDDALIIELEYDRSKKKTPAKDMKRWIAEELAPVVADLNIKYILCADGDYFKILAKTSKIDVNLGYVLDSILGTKIIYLPNYRAIFHDPITVRGKIDQALTALRDHRNGVYEAPGLSIIEFEAYPKTDAEIEQWLIKLLEMNKPLTIDIEGFALKHTKSGIGTISFAWSKTEGIAFPIDYVESYIEEGFYGKQVRNEYRRKMLKRFFELLQKTAIYHSISFDVYILIYQLFMDNILDIEGLLEGMDVMLRNWDCTKLITYLATNSCAGNRLSLKDQAQEYAGNYSMGEDIKDIRKIPLDKLLQYNLVDALSTWYVREKHHDTMIADNQFDIYNDVFKPATVDIVQMQLTGMPVNMKTVSDVENQLNKIQLDLQKLIAESPIIQQYVYRLEEIHIQKRNAKLVKKQIKIGDEPQQFNPNSGPQLQDLLFGFLALPVINLTDNKEPSTDGETLEALLNHTIDPQVIALLNPLMELKVVSKLTSSFIPALKEAALGPDGWHYLFGNFNLGGTLSGRLSSSDPNLQNLPSTGKGKALNAKYAKLIKMCFEAPPGWLFGGIDFDSLEDKISALTTKDPNKIKVYTDGYDGHSLRAYSYFGNQMPDIDFNSVESINSVAKKYKPLRDRSKNPTFTLTYQGTYHALMKKYGFSEEQAKEIEAKYHELYKVSDDWVNAQLDEAMITGFIVGAFGLRLRTPLLKQVIRGNSKTPYEAQAEGRTAGNALGQSWCILNSRAGSEFLTKVRKSKYRLLIKPCAQIHDSQFFLIKDDIEVLQYANKHVVKAVSWQDHPAIQHDLVKLSGGLSVFYPNWTKEISIPKDGTKEEIFQAIDKAISV